MQKTGCAMSLTLISVNTVDILYNKEYNYGLVVMDNCTTTTVTYTVKEN